MFNHFNSGLRKLKNGTKTICLFLLKRKHQLILQWTKIRKLPAKIMRNLIFSSISNMNYNFLYIILYMSGQRLAQVSLARLFYIVAYFEFFHCGNIPFGAGKSKLWGQSFTSGHAHETLDVCSSIFIFKMATTKIKMAANMTIIFLMR